MFYKDLRRLENRRVMLMNNRNEGYFFLNKIKDFANTEVKRRVIECIEKYTDELTQRVHEIDDMDLKEGIIEKG